VWSINASSLNYSSEMAVLKADVHPPLYFLTLNAWIRLFGKGERAVRGLSGLFYLLCVYGMYRLGRDLYGRATGLLCATIYLTSPLAILSAQFARMYSLLSLLSILSTWLYLQFSLKPRESPLPFVAYTVVNILGTFTHIAFFFVLFGQIVFHILFYRQMRIRRFVAAILLSVIPYVILWGPVLLGQVAQSEEGLAWAKRPGIAKVAELLAFYGGVLWLTVPLLLYFGWRTRFKSSNGSKELRFTTFPFWLLAITMLTPIIFSQIKPIFNPRFGIIGLHLFALGAGSIAVKRSSYFLIFLLTVLTTIGLVVLHPASSPCDNRAIAGYLTQTANNGDVVIFTSLTRLPIDYYLEQEAISKKLFETSFPAEIDKHPGYEGRTTDPSRQAALEHEARLLVEKISNAAPDRTRRIFFFHGLHPEIDLIMERSLLDRYELLSGVGVQCEVSPYFKNVSIYK
jgi:uncharacterized membrane protein